MRILQINKFFYEKGGSERYFFSVSRALESRGHEVVHFSMQHPDNVESPWSDYFVSRRDYHERASLPEQVRRGLGIVRSPEAARNVARLVEAARPDVAHLHNIYHQLTPSIISALARAGVPMVMTPHDYKLVCPKYSLFDGESFCYRCKGGHYFRAALTRCEGGSFARSALLAFESYWQKATHAYDPVRFILAPSRFMRDTLVEASWGEDRVLYLRSFVTDDEIDESGDFAKEAESLLIPEKFVLYFGRLSEEKGVSTVIDAIAGLKDVTVVICGDGPLSGTLRQRAEGLDLGHRVRFLGFVGKPRLNSIVRRARAVVMPSEWPENAPFSVIEAMACAVPVIVSKMGGLPELAELSGGLQFDAGDVPGLAACLDRLWHDDRLADALALQSRAAARSFFDREDHLNQLEDIYRRAIDDAP